ncbi:MAG: NmrA/HSCARG family protein [Gemmatimonadetes bacterium]|nr:NmrA/HSCARG family protein [Gemmatimonadota bacterium]
MQTGKDLIAVFGATGSQGGATIHELLQAGHKVRAVTRKPEGGAAKALAARGAEVVKADLDDAASLERALSGAWGVFAVQNTWEAGVEREEVQGKRIAEIARKKEVQHFVYTSVGSAQHKTGIPHFDNKWRVEETVRSLHFPSYTILRPVFFMDNFGSPWFKPGLAEGKLVMGIKPTTTLQMIAVADIGKFGLLAFEQHERMNGREIDLAGDQHTMPDAAEILAKAMGKKITFVEQPIDEVRKWSEDYAIMLEWFIRVGYSVDIPRLAKEYDIRLTTLAEWASRVRWT